MSLKGRWAITLAAVAIVAVAVVGLAAAALTTRGLRAEVDRSLMERADALAAVGPGDLARRLPELPRRVRGIDLLRPLMGPDFEVQVITPSGEIVFAFENAPTLPVGENDLAVAGGDEPQEIRTVTVDGRRWRVVTAPLRGGAVQVGRDLEPIEGLVAGLGRRLFVVGLVAGAVAAAVGWWLAGRAVRPIEELTSAAEGIASTQELTAPLPSGGPDEVGRLARSFGTMITALDRSRRQQHQLVADAGHELRTPLTGLRTNIEVLRRQPGLPADERSILVDAALAETEELGVLVAELVDLATDARLSPEEPVVRIIGDLVEPVVERYRRLLGRQITVEGTGGTTRVRPTQFERALSNLLDNAAKWSSEPIEVTIADTTVRVRDHGPGVPEAELPRIFDRFYRSPISRDRPGSGLGLAIVQQAVEANGGSVFAHNHPEGGAVVGFTLADARHLPPYAQET